MNELHKLQLQIEKLLAESFRLQGYVECPLIDRYIDDLDSLIGLSVKPVDSPHYINDEVNYRSLTKPSLFC